MRDEELWEANSRERVGLPRFDPDERERNFTCTVNIMYFGRPEDRQRLATQVARKLHPEFGERVQVLVNGEVVLFDPVLDDGNPPPNYSG